MTLILQRAHQSRNSNFGPLIPTAFAISKQNLHLKNQQCTWEEAFRVINIRAGIYITRITIGNRIGKPQRCEPKSFSNSSKGLPESGFIKNIKLVPQSRFKPYTGMAIATSRAVPRRADFRSVDTCFVVTSSIGYSTSKIWMVKL